LVIQDIQLEKVSVGNIDIEDKMFGKGDPIVLSVNGIASETEIVCFYASCGQ
jgi:hypothetical protein